MTRITTTWIFLGALLGAQEPGAQFSAHVAEVTGNRVRVRGGDGDYHAILTHLDRGDLVRVVARKGDWLRVQVPGGVPVHASMGNAGRRFLEERARGEGVVVANDLMLRGTPSTEFPPVGRLRAGERVVILDVSGEFARVVAPEQTTAYIHQSYLREASDQTKAASGFAAKDVTSRQALLRSGEHSRELLASTLDAEAKGERAKTAFKSFEDERARPVEDRRADEVRTDLAKVRDELPSGHPDRIKAEALLTSVEGWDETKKQLADVRAGFDSVAREAENAEKRYAEQLEELRKKSEEDRERKKKGEPIDEGPYLVTGILRRNATVSGVVGKAPEWGLYQGDRPVCYLESRRYDLSHFANLRVGLKEADGPSIRPDVPTRVYVAKRLEILSRR